MPDQVINGIGNEVLVCAICFVIALMTIIFYLRQNFVRSQQNPVQPSPDGQSENVEVPSVYNRETCPICLCDHSLPLETNCGHLFCGACMRRYYDISNMGLVTCPLCRNNVNMLYVVFTNEEKENPQLEEERQNIYSFVDEYNHRSSLIRRTLREVLLDWPTTMRHLWNDLFSINGLMYVTRAPISLCIVAAVVYILSPLDIIPECVFGLLGLLDDLFIIFFIGIYVSVVYRQLVITRGAAGNGL